MKPITQLLTQQPPNPFNIFFWNAVIFLLYIGNPNSTMLDFHYSKDTLLAKMLKLDF